MKPAMDQARSEWLNVWFEIKENTNHTLLLSYTAPNLNPICFKYHKILTMTAQGSLRAVKFERWDVFYISTILQRDDIVLPFIKLFLCSNELFLRYLFWMCVRCHSTAVKQLHSSASLNGCWIEITKCKWILYPLWHFTEKRRFRNSHEVYG